MSRPKRTAPRKDASASHDWTKLGPAVKAPSSFPVRSTGLRSGPTKKCVLPLRERCWVSIDEARQVAGEGRTKIYELIALGELLSKKVGRRRLVNVVSLLDYCGESDRGDPEAATK
jgi:hypothetical protein